VARRVQLYCSTMAATEFKVGDLVRCVSRKGVFAKQLKPTVGARYIVTDVEPGLYSYKLNVRRENEQHSILSAALFSSVDFEHVKMQEM